MSIAPNGRFMACFLSNGVLTVMTTNFSKKILDFDTNSTRKPAQMVEQQPHHTQARET